MDVQISNVFETRRQKRCFNIGNYKFSEFRILKSGDIIFRCTNKKCKSTVTVNGSFKVISMSNTHDHEPYSDQVISREIIRSSVKRKANDNLHMMPSKLIRRDLRSMNDIASNLARTDMKLLRRSIYDIRKKTSVQFIAAEQLVEVQMEIENDEQNSDRHFV